MNAKLFQIRLLKRILKRGKNGALDRDPPRKPDSRTCERKAHSERDSCVCILTHSIRDSENSIDFVQGPPGSRRERVKNAR